MTLQLTPAEYGELLRSPFLDEQLVGPRALALVVVTGSPSSLPSPGALPLVVAALGAGSVTNMPQLQPAGVDLPGADVVVTDDELADLEHMVGANPLAATALAILLRSAAGGGVEAGLAAESAVYSTLQAGPEFARWRATSSHHDAPPDHTQSVCAERDGDALHIRLQRPARHNAITARLRDELCAALWIAVADDTIRAVHLRGDGPSFCSGGDLGEFGSRSDPAAAHHIRLARSPARLLHRLGDRLTVHLHGAALGGGIEMAAFAGRVVATPDTHIGLPEVGLGLIPGAGGTVSITERIGRQRTAWLALTGREIDATTALRWGLVDSVVP